MGFSAANLTYLGGLICPKVASDDVTYLPDSYPAEGVSRDALHFGGRPVAIDTVRRELVMGTKYGRVARFTLVEPAPHADGGNASTFPTLPYVSPTMVDLSGPSIAEENPPTVNKSWFEICDPYDTANTSFGGCLPVGDQILLAGQVYYDANGTQRKSVALAHWPAVPPAADYHPNRTPFRAVGDPGGQGLVAGYFAPIPEGPWRDRLKGDVLMGNASLPIITRGSAGPCATSFHVADVVTHEQIPTTLLVGYPNGHWMPGHPWDNPKADEVYNFATMITGMAILGDTLVFVGSHGYGVPCYGDGVADPALADGVSTCYDPTTSAKANHAYPYRLQVWHYPLEDLAAVAAGEKAPWDLLPEWFELVVPFVQPSHQVNGCAFDPPTNRFYLSMYAADGYGYEPGPVIYVFEFDEGAETVEPPPVDQSEQIERLEQTIAAIETEAEIIAEHTAEILKLTSEAKR